MSFFVPFSVFCHFTKPSIVGHPLPAGEREASRTSRVRGVILFVFLSLCVFFSLPAHAATSIPFTINLSENVTVTGTPRIQLDVGGVTRYANYTSGSGTNALVFTYTMVSGDVDNDGVVLSSPIQLNGGTIKDAAGNNATLTFTVPNTSNVRVNAAVPSGYTASFIDKTVTNANKTNFGFTLNYNKPNKTLHYSIASSGGGTPITGTATTTGSSQNITGLNVTSLPDGKLTLSAYLTDSIGGTGTTVTDIAPMAVLDASLVGHWTFDANDISGATAYDRSGQGNNGTLTNGPTQITGQVGGALNFDGVSQLVSYSNPPAVQISDGTIVSWVKTSNAGAGYRGIFTKSQAFGTYFFNNIFGAYDPGSGAFRSSSINAADGNWHQAVLVFSSGNSGASKLYLDGVVVNSSTTITILLQTGAPRSGMGQGGTPQCFLGLIDDVRIYNRALTPTEITTLYNASH